MTKLHELNNLGQSIWFDNIRRALLDSAMSSLSGFYAEARLEGAIR